MRCRNSSESVSATPFESSSKLKRRTKKAKRKLKMAIARFRPCQCRRVPFLECPRLLTVPPVVDLCRLQNGYVVCSASERMAMLIRILKQEAFVEGDDVAGARKFIVYFATCACVDYFFKVCRARSLTCLQSRRGLIAPGVTGPRFSRISRLSPRLGSRSTLSTASNRRTGDLRRTMRSRRSLRPRPASCSAQTLPPEVSTSRTSTS